jgi:hypothetical protein
MRLLRCVQHNKNTTSSYEVKFPVSLSSCCYVLLLLLKFWIVRMESNGVHSARRPPIGLLYLPRVLRRMENLVEWWLAGETEVPGENLSQCLFVNNKSHMNWPGANRGHSGGKPATNRLSYGTGLLRSIPSFLLQLGNGSNSQFTIFDRSWF